MPSCSSKFKCFRKYEFDDTLETASLLRKLVLGCLFHKTRRLLFDFECLIKIFCWCITTNTYSNLRVKKLCQVPECCFVCVKNQTESIFTKELSFQCEIQKVKKSYNLVVFQLFNHNVICLFFIHHWIHNFLILLKVKELSVKFKFLRNLFDIVMEVDETNIHDNNLPNGEKTISSPGLNQCGDHSTVIKENQIMIKAEYQINSDVTNGNNNDCKIKEEKLEEEERGIENGDMIVNITDSKKILDLIEVSQTVLNDACVKDKPNDINGDNLFCKEETNHLVNNQKVKSEEKVEARLDEVKSSKDKYREKDQCLINNHVSSISSSSSSSKKHNIQSRSHQSSSSSRHKYKDGRDDKHKSSSSSTSSSRSNEVSSTRKDEDRLKSESRSKSRSCHHKPEEKCHCKSHHHSHHHSRKTKKYQSVKIQCTPEDIAFEVQQNKANQTNPYFTRVPWVPHPQLTNLKYGRYIRIEMDRNGGATVCHLYMDEISHLNESQMKECASEFIKLSYSEDENECAYHVMGIVHGAASYLPDLVDYMADHYPTLIVKTGSLASRDNHTTTMAQYRDEVYKTYSNGTFRYAPLDQLSICGVLGEEVGAYFPDFVARLEQSPFMKPVMPWSSLSVVETDNPRESNDGPIFWVRPGEQMLPANEALKESARPKKRRNNELDNLAYIGGSRFSEARESLFQDRTKAHADQVGVDYGISNTAPTAAVGVLKAVNCGHPEHGNRATKDVVAFHAQDYNELLEILMLDLYEPPQTQCTKWIEVSKLNTLRREGIRYAHLQLHDNDVYYLPRKIIHQFQTISSVASVAWHIRYRDYFSVLGAPNLHTPTGINKGQVFYEKKNVAVYCPPVCENDLLAAVTNGEPGMKTPKKVDRLKEYSPFKQSPRKMSKHQYKKQSVPPSSNASKNEPETPNSLKTESSEIKDEPRTPATLDQEKKSTSGSSKKRERSKSDDGSSPADRSSKEESRKENCHNRRSSGDQTPFKKDRKSQDHHSSHRKEVKNLDAEFSGKKDKSSRERSPKSKHESKKHGSGSSKKRRHEDSPKSKSSSREHGEDSQKIKTEGKSESSLKRKHEDNLNHSESKKIKEENPDSGTGKQNSKKDEIISTGNSNCLGVAVKDEIVLDSKDTEATEEKENICESESNAGNQIVVDLSQVSYTGFINQIPPFPPPLPPLPPPPPPPTSPPVCPPPPPSPPLSDSPVKNPQENCINSAVVAKDRSEVKKAKKKMVKKTNESYDLLGDIMSKMDKKK